MPIIPIHNGTTFITVECATLTQLQYCQDEEIWRCEYSNWAYGLFAIAAVIVLMLPILLIIKCAIYYHHQYKHQETHPNYSRQTSHSTLYPEHSRDLMNLPYGDDDDLAVVEPKRKNKDKSYYPYPAYGTYADGGSFLGSHASLQNYNEQPENQEQQSPPVRYPRLSQESRPGPSDPMLISTPNERQPLLHNISSSAPVVNAVLRNTRENLCNPAQKPNFSTTHGSSHSLNNIDSKSEKSLVDFQEHLRNGIQRSLPASTISTTTTASDGPVMMKPAQLTNPSSIPPTLAQNDPSTNPNAMNIPTDVISDDFYDRTEKERTASNLSFHEKHRILAATPEKNMISRQDFDDYLADCVLKLPEDQRNGTFLIRNSTSVPNSKEKGTSQDVDVKNQVLTLYCKSEENNASLFYFKVHFTEEENVYLENTNVVFKDLDELIDYHKRHRSLLPCLLGDCLGKNF